MRNRVKCLLGALALGVLVRAGCGLSSSLASEPARQDAVPNLLPLPDGLDPELYALTVGIREMATTFEPLREQLEQQAMVLPQHQDQE